MLEKSGKCNIMAGDNVDNFLMDSAQVCDFVYLRETESAERVNLENCIDLASDEAMNIIGDLTEAAKEDIDELIEDLQKFCEVYSSIIENLREREIRKVNSEIDNT